MKNIITKIGQVLLILIALPLFVVLIVGLSPIIICFIALDWWRKLFMRLRHDPRYKSPAEYHIYFDGNYPEGKKVVLREYFDKFVAAIKKNAGVSDVSEVQVEESGDNQGENDNVYEATFSVIVQGKIGKARLEMQASGVPDVNKDLFTFTALQDEDRPPYLNVVYTQNDGLRTVFDVSGYDTLEFLIASMRHGQTLSRAGQIWTMLQKDVYIVNYSVKKSEKSDRIDNDYGYRKNFSDAKARLYFFDKK